MKYSLKNHVDKICFNFHLVRVGILMSIRIQSIKQINMNIPRKLLYLVTHHHTITRYLLQYIKKKTLNKKVQLLFSYHLFEFLFCVSFLLLFLKKRKIHKYILHFSGDFFLDLHYINIFKYVLVYVLFIKCIF